jgi:drug/metabolite transporter (DMT)-like permease
MTILFGLGAAIAYGLADFFGGFVSKKITVFAVVFWGQLGGSVVMALAFPLFPAPFSSEAVWWGAAAGITGGIGVLFLYQGLSIGRMSVVAPLTAVEAASFPVLFGFVIGERPSELSIAGILVALIAVYLVSSSPFDDPGEAPRASGIREALVAGASFGAFFILLERAGDDSGMWPLVGARIAAISVSLIGAVLLRSNLKATRAESKGILAAGWLDVVANIFFLLSVRRGLLALAAVLTSMYPATTVVCARIFLKERVHRRQLVGLALVFTAIALIGFG